MKEIALRFSVITLGIGLSFLNWTLPGFAISERYPTDAEVNQLRQDFTRRRLPEIRKFIKQRVAHYPDRRTPSQIQTLKQFAQAWSTVNASTAPFLGEWTGEENWVMIYPSTVKNRVCVVYMPGDVPEVVNFGVGRVSNNQVRVNLDGDEPVVLILEQGFLGLIQVHKNKAELWDQTNPQPLQELASSPYRRDTSQIIQAFNSAGCTASLPR